MSKQIEISQLQKVINDYYKSLNKCVDEFASIKKANHTYVTAHAKMEDVFMRVNNFKQQVTQKLYIHLPDSFSEKNKKLNIFQKTVRKEIQQINKRHQNFVDAYHRLVNTMKEA